jgi:nicotinate-nucleotide adenylyltransferase
MSALKCIGIFGGSFDPVHCGHLALSLLARKQLGLEAIYFVPAKCPPHKLKKTLAGAKDRVNMLRLCIGKNEHVSHFELKRKGTTYSWQTLRYFKARFPKSKIYFILGSDSLNELGAWKRPGLISKYCTIVAGMRRGAKFAAPGLFSDSVVRLRGKIPAISSTDIRKRLAGHKPIKDLVENSVADYITKHHLYENIE